MILAFHKPYGVLSQFTRQKAGQRTLAEFGFPKHVYPLGRLDWDSEGLLLFAVGFPTLRLIRTRITEGEIVFNAEGSKMTQKLIAGKKWVAKRGVLTYEILRDPSVNPWG